MGTFGQDIRYGSRMLWKNPGFTVVAVVTLALGVGANAAIFSIVDAVLLRPLPYKNSEQLVKITGDFGRLNQHDVGLSEPELEDLQKDSRLIDGVAGLLPINSNLTGGEQPARVEAILDTANYFSILGVNAAMGRVFGPQDTVGGIGTVAVLSDSAWKRRFGADPNIIGKQIRIDEDLYTVVGVMPANFRHPGKALLSGTELWAPSGFAATPFPNPPIRTARFLQGALARLRPGVSITMAQAQLDSLSEALRRQYPDFYPENNGWTLHVSPLQQDLTGNVRPALLVLLAVVGFVLLIACVNVANLLLARAGARQGEIAIRLALGATRFRLLRQLLAESLLLSVLGGALGLALASSTFDLLIRPGFENPSALAESLTREVHAVDPQVPVYGAKTMDEIVSRALSGRRFSMQLLVLFAALALVLSAVGIYGVVKYFVNQRTHEIGIRMELGAQPRDVLRLVFGFGLTMSLVGVGIGLAGALLITRWLSGLLYGVSTTDAVTFAAVPLLLSLVALLACHIPARRAMRVDPIVALRYE